MSMSFQMVIHVDFGGFSLTRSVYERLKQRGVEWLPRCAKNSMGCWYLPYEDGEELRRDPDLIEVVRQLEAEVEEFGAKLETWEERRDLERRLLGGIRNITVHVNIEIEEHAGRETVRVTGGAW